MLGLILCIVGGIFRNITAVTHAHYSSFKLCTTNIYKHIKLKQVSDIYMPADYIMLPIFLFPGNDQINEGLCWVNWFLNLVIKSQ